MKEKSIDLGQCIIDCNGDQSCEQSCVTLFKYQYEKCPCQVNGDKNLMSNLTLVDLIFKKNCPFGCPCDSFDCRPDKKSVLVLNTNGRRSKPVLIKFDGKFELKIR